MLKQSDLSLLGINAEVKRASPERKCNNELNAVTEKLPRRLRDRRSGVSQSSKQSLEHFHKNTPIQREGSILRREMYFTSGEARLTLTLNAVTSWLPRRLREILKQIL